MAYSIRTILSSFLKYKPSELYQYSINMIRHCTIPNGFSIKQFSGFMWEVYGQSNPINFPLSKIENFNNWLHFRLSSSSLILLDDKTEPNFHRQRISDPLNYKHILIKRGEKAINFYVRNVRHHTIGKLNIFPQCKIVCNHSSFFY